MHSKHLLYAIFLFYMTAAQNFPSNDPSVYYTMLELVCADGYHVQEHKIITEDGYILTVHRIPNASRRPKTSKRSKQFQKLHTSYHPDFAHCVNESIYQKASGPPVIMAHGLFSASDNFVLQGPESDLSYSLANAGYDVWFTNVRGNFYSRNHITLRPSNPSFWNYSFHEMGIYDIPAIIDYILQLTGYNKLTYIGHSMGTTMFFVMCSIKPEYNEKIKLFLGMTPVSEIKHKNFSKQRRSNFYGGYMLVNELKRRKRFELLPRVTITAIFSRAICGITPFQDICYDLSFSFTGYHSKLFLRKKLPVYLAHGLSGSSTKTIDHFAQFFLKPFSQFNYGTEENLRRYGQQDPPLYDYKKIKVPVALFYSADDYIVDPKDVQILIDNLPNVIETHLMKKYSHVDYLWAYNAKDLVYPKMLALVNKFNDN